MALGHAGIHFVSAGGVGWSLSCAVVLLAIDSPKTSEPMGVRALAHS